MAAPLVSVLMTAYNREKYIAEAIESILAQTFSDLELIIVDDCSNDNTVDVARRYTCDRRVCVHINERNLGDYPNRNRAASFAIGKYLKYVDADDYMYPNGLGIITEMMERFPQAGVGLASFPQDPRGPYPILLSPHEAYYRHYFLHPLFHRAPLSALIRRDAFIELGGFSGKRWVGDFEMWQVLAARFPVLMMPDGIVWYRQHSEQEMQHNRGDPRVRFRYQVVAYEQLTKTQCPLLPAERAAAVRQVKRRQARAILRALVESRGRYVGQMLRESNLRTWEVLSAAFAQ